MNGIEQVWGELTKKQALDEFILKEIYQKDIQIIKEEKEKDDELPEKNLDISLPDDEDSFSNRSKLSENAIQKKEIENKFQTQLSNRRARKKVMRIQKTIDQDQMKKLREKKGLAQSLGNSRRSIEQKKKNITQTTSDLLKNNIHININIGKQKKDQERKESIGRINTERLNSKERLFQLFNPDKKEKTNTLKPPVKKKKIKPSNQFFQV